MTLDEQEVEEASDNDADESIVQVIVTAALAMTLIVWLRAASFFIVARVFPGLGDKRVHKLMGSVEELVGRYHDN